MVTNHEFKANRSMRIDEFVSKMNENSHYSSPSFDLSGTRLYYKFPEIADEMLDTAIELFSSAEVTFREQNVILRFADSFARQPELIQGFRRLTQEHRDTFLKYSTSMHEKCLAPYLTALRLAGNPLPNLRNNLVNSADADSIEDPSTSKYLMAINDVRLAKAVQSYSKTQFIRGVEFIFEELEKVYPVETILYILEVIESRNLNATPMDMIRLINSWESMKEIPIEWTLNVAPDVSFEL